MFTKLNNTDLKRGDILFFSGNRGIRHAGVFLNWTTTSVRTKSFDPLQAKVVEKTEQVRIPVVLHSNIDVGISKTAYPLSEFAKLAYAVRLPKEKRQKFLVLTEKWRQNSVNFSEREKLIYLRDSHQANLEEMSRRFGADKLSGIEPEALRFRYDEKHDVTYCTHVLDDGREQRILGCIEKGDKRPEWDLAAAGIELKKNQESYLVNKWRLLKYAARREFGPSVGKEVGNNKNGVICSSFIVHALQNLELADKVRALELPKDKWCSDKYHNASEAEIAAFPVAYQKYLQQKQAHQEDRHTSYMPGASFWIGDLSEEALDEALPNFLKVDPKAISPRSFFLKIASTPSPYEIFRVKHKTLEGKEAYNAFQAYLKVSKERRNEHYVLKARSLHPESTKAKNLAEIKKQRYPKKS